MTFAQYLSYQAPRGFDDELIHGEIRLSPSARASHQDICKHLERLLDAAIPPSFIAQRDTTVFIDGIEGPRPDVFVMKRDRWNSAKESALGYPQGVPELVIEVMSASNTDEEMEEKRNLYFSDPRCAALWIVKPDTKTVSIFTPKAADAIHLTMGQSVELPTEIGGLVSTTDIFQ